MGAPPVFVQPSAESWRKRETMAYAAPQWVSQRTVLAQRQHVEGVEREDCREAVVVAFAAWIGFEPRTFSAGSPVKRRLPAIPCRSIATFVAQQPAERRNPSPEWGSVCPAAW